MMKIKSKMTLSTLFAMLCVCLSHAQESVVAAGGDAAGSGGSVSYSIGQVVYTTDMNSGGSVAKGVQHAYEIYTTSIDETGFGISLTAFPNPVSDYIILQIRDDNEETLSYRLIDAQGKVAEQGHTVGRQTQVSTARLAAGTYFMHIENSKNEIIQTFTIIKN